MTTHTASQGWFRPTRPNVAIEVGSGRVTVASISGAGSKGRATVSAWASEPLPSGAVVPSLAGQNVQARDEVIAAMRRALEKAGLRSVRRAALVIPDSAAHVSFVDLEAVPARAADLDRVLRWQLRKALPFPVDQARMSHMVAHAEAGRTTLAATLAKFDVLAEYESLCTALGIQAGIVDLASFNVANAVMATGLATGDSLLVCLAPEATTLLILRKTDLMFYRHRASAGDEPIGTLVHQTAMFHVDRLGGSTFDRVWIAGSSAHPGGAGVFKAEVEARLGVPVDPVNVRDLATVRTGGSALSDVDPLAASVGVILREMRVA